MKEGVRLTQVVFTSEDRFISRDWLSLWVGGGVGGVLSHKHHKVQLTSLFQHFNHIESQHGTKCSTLGVDGPAPSVGTYPPHPHSQDSDAALTCLHPGRSSSWRGVVEVGFGPVGVRAEEVHAETFMGGGGGGGGGAVSLLFPLGDPV